MGTQVAKQKNSIIGRVTKIMRQDAKDDEKKLHAISEA